VYHYRAGYPTITSYSDGTPTVTVVPGRNGQATTMTDAAGTHAYTYANGGQILSESISGTEPLAGLSYAYHYMPNGEFDTLQVSSSNSTIYQVSRSFSPDSGLLKSVTSGLASANYSYKPNSALVNQVDTRWNGTTSLLNTRTYDVLDRLLTTKHFASSSAQPINYASYELDDLGRKKKTTFQDGSFWDYGYNDRGEVIRADKKLNSAFLAGQQFRYTPDNIGNVVSKETGGDANGTSRRFFTTPANNLNQHSNYDTPGSFDILGQAPASPAVTVNGNAAAYQGNYFRSEVTASNSNANGDWKSISVVSGGQARTGNIYVAPASFTPTYDFDGNLTDDGEWNYAWDGENRLKSATRSSRAQTAGAPYRRVEFVYDSQNRCVQRSEFTAIAGPATGVERSIYDGWNRVATLDGSNSIQQKFTWGLDLTGSLTAAGGVGALLWIEDTTSGAVHFASSDGNGNVTSLINGATKNLTASYEYGPFGESIRRSGSYADKNPYRFSSKVEDSLTGLLYYGHRYYKASWGIWLSKDPVSEVGGINLYQILKNDAINKIDRFGLSPWENFNNNLSDMLNGFDQPIRDGGSHEGDWPGALYDLQDWLRGHAPSETVYENGNPKSVAMSKSPIGIKLRDGYLKKYSSKPLINWADYTNVDLGFGPNEFIASIPNGQAHFVGSGRGDAEALRVDRRCNSVTVKFTITNTTSLKSALFHAIPNSWNNTKTGTPRANWTQKYIWEQDFGRRRWF